MLLKIWAFFVCVSFEVPGNDIWTDKILSFGIIVQYHWELEMVHESQLGKVQIKWPLIVKIKL